MIYFEPQKRISYEIEPDFDMEREEKKIQEEFEQW
jgi:hypothetical protein